MHRCTHQSLSLVWRDDGDLDTFGGGDVVYDFLLRVRTFGAGELHVKNVRHFSDERQPTGQFPSDFFRLFSETLRLGLLRRVVHGTRVLHGGVGGTRFRRRDRKKTHKINDCARTNGRTCTKNVNLFK